MLKFTFNNMFRNILLITSSNIRENKLLEIGTTFFGKVESKHFSLVRTKCLYLKTKHETKLLFTHG